mgnify:CR=1 FL=1
MGIETLLFMIPKGGKYAKSVVNFVHKTVDDWPKFKEAIKQIVDLLKIGRLRLDGKQKTIFETNKNILKIGKWQYNNLSLVLFDLSHVNNALINHDSQPVDGIIGADVKKKSKNRKNFCFSYSKSSKKQSSNC